MALFVRPVRLVTPETPVVIVLQGILIMVVSVALVKLLVHSAMPVPLEEHAAPVLRGTLVPLAAHAGIYTILHQILH